MSQVPFPFDKASNHLTFPLADPVGKSHIRLAVVWSFAYEMPRHEKSSDLGQ